MPREAGTYHARLVGSGVAKLGNEKATPYIYLTFKLMHFWHDGEWKSIRTEETAEVRKFLSDKAWPYTEGDLKRIGFNGDFDNPAFAAELYEEGISLICNHETRDGRTFEDWSMVRQEKEHTPLDSDQVALLKARWKQNNVAAPAGAPPAPPSPLTGHTNQPAPAPGDEPPF